MYPPKFDYVRAGSIEEAIELVGANEDAIFLAGGHSIIPSVKMRLSQPGTLVDIGRISGLKGITREGDNCRIGALTTHAMVADNDELPHGLSHAASCIGDQQVRNRGTVGGNIAHADPASDLPTILLALGATVHVTGAGGSRTIAIDDFFLDLFETAIEEGEIITAVTVPSEGDNSGSAYTKLSNPASYYAMVGAAASLTVDNSGKVTAARVAVGGLTNTAQRAPSVEAALMGGHLHDKDIAAAAAAVANDLGDDVMGDIHASADYRRSMAPVFVERALRAAAEQAGVKV